MDTFSELIKRDSAIAQFFTFKETLIIIACKFIKYGQDE